MSGNRPADPVVRGTRATAKQAWGDLWRWEQRVTVTNELGEEHTEWRRPEPLKNPITLLRLLSAKDSGDTVLANSFRLREQEHVRKGAENV